MAQTKSVVLVGLDPSVVDYEKWSGLTPERLRGALEADRATLERLGLDARICFVDEGPTAVATLREALVEASPDVILIGAGVRTDPDHFLLFERLVNAVHRHAPAAAICFNTGPTDSVAAVQRWLQS